MTQLLPDGTAIEILGRGPPIVFLHGVGLDRTMWADQVEALASSHQVITYDLLGHGKSPAAAANAPLADWIGQLNSVVRHLALGRFTLVGFSFGGLIAQGYASMHPEMIDKLVLMSTVHDRNEAERASVISRLETARCVGPGAIVSAALSRWFSSEFAEAHPDVMNHTAAILRGNDVESFLSAYGCFAVADRHLVGALADFTRPTLVMTGELDVGSTPVMARILAGMIPLAECSIIAGGRHMMPVEMPEAVNSVLCDFLNGGSP